MIRRPTRAHRVVPAVMIAHSLEVSRVVPLCHPTPLAQKSGELGLDLRGRGLEIEAQVADGEMVGHGRFLLVGRHAPLTPS